MPRQRSQFKDELLEQLANADSIAVLTGAGISAASGVPTFRGKDGLWKNFKAEELANFNAFSQNPELVWEWYMWRRELINKVEPNKAHYALVDMETLTENFVIITQNVDNLHRLAGSRNIIELHGNIMQNKCTDCSKPHIGEISLLHGVPKCQQCGGFIRPDVVWFGELLPENAIHSAKSWAMKSQIFIVVGTSGVVEPAASLPFIAKANDALLIEINTEQTPLTTHMDEFFVSPADEVLPKLINAIRNFKI
jgi:NAD-dependent deacetylase